MKKFKLNSFTSMLLAFSILLFTFLIFEDEKIEKYEQVTIVQGDTLWSLAETYRGKMAKNDWINFVKEENGLQDEKVLYGQVLVVPVEKESYYIANLNQNDSTNEKTVKVARSNGSN
ncbi:LysM peptidoglycan-binding domain-containing protein [Solibacillus sp. MA9]|uniref:LysM peptidoglycan-binding domain-containing protein n=1 Tax=Solibacillus palustris TaxID=2908203 RepID=A0ABS9UBF5_9BACL|nr:LysM peptidoglycan-binding domain-containing protein [Solibacillus sp. MA9]MCH7321659.1 LysM peptidoglycan-binding domain-containing protein [Solibacillus sp. MA9]